jgi:hypothetical protein
MREKLTREEVTQIVENSSEKLNMQNAAIHEFMLANGGSFGGFLRPPVITAKQKDVVINKVYRQWKMKSST